MPNSLRLSRGHISSSCAGASRTSKRMISWPPTLESIQPVRRAVNSQKLSLSDRPHSCTRPLKFLWYAVTTYKPLKHLSIDWHVPDDQLIRRVAVVLFWIDAVVDGSVFRVPPQPIAVPIRWSMGSTSSLRPNMAPVVDARALPRTASASRTPMKKPAQHLILHFRRRASAY